MYLDYGIDESYTPSRVSVRAGTGFYDLQEVCMLEMNEPRGWIPIALGAHGQRLEKQFEGTRLIAQ